MKTKSITHTNFRQNEFCFGSNQSKKSAKFVDIFKCLWFFVAISWISLKPGGSLWCTLCIPNVNSVGSWQMSIKCTEIWCCHDPLTEFKSAKVHWRRRTKGIMKGELATFGKNCWLMGQSVLRKIVQIFSRKEIHKVDLVTSVNYPSCK